MITTEHETYIDFTEGDRSVIASPAAGGGWWLVPMWDEQARTWIGSRDVLERAADSLLNPKPPEPPPPPTTLLGRWEADYEARCFIRPYRGRVALPDDLDVKLKPRKRAEINRALSAHFRREGLYWSPRQKGGQLQITILLPLGGEYDPPSFRVDLRDVVRAAVAEEAGENCDAVIAILRNCIRDVEKAKKEDTL